MGMVSIFGGRGHCKTWGFLVVALCDTNLFVSKCMVYVKKLSCCSCCTPKLGSKDPI